MKKKLKRASIVASTLLLLTSQAFGASVMYMNSGGIGGGFGNSDTRAANGSMVTATAWSWTGSGWEEGQLREYSLGLGVCNQTEEGLHAPVGNCQNSLGEHAADNVEQIDFVLLEFDTQVILEEGTLSYWSTDTVNDADRDITYWSGLGGPDFSNGLDNLTSRVDRDLPLINGNGQVGSVDFSALVNPVDWLLIGARVGDVEETVDVNGALGFIIADAIKVKAIEFTAVPVPPVAILFGTGLAGLVGLARRHGFMKKSSSE